jgi:hypothetical protein
MTSDRFGDRDFRSLLKRTASRIQANFSRAEALDRGRHQARRTLFNG